MMDSEAEYLERGAAQESTDARQSFRLLSDALRLTWEANKLGFVLAAALQVAGAVVVSVFVLVGRSALDGLLAIGQRPESPIGAEMRET